MSRKPIIAGNWKMNLCQSEAKSVFEGIANFVKDYTAQELIALDCKKCELKDKKAKIAQVNIADIPEMMKRKAEFEEAISKDIEENNLDIFVFAMTDIINSNSQAIVLGKAKEVFEKGFNTKLEDNTAFLPGVVSRKKQILPVLQENA